MTGPIRVKATHAIVDGKFDEFRRLGQQFIDKVESTEPGYLSYEWYLSSDEKTCTIVGVLESSDAVMNHLGNVGDLIAQFSEIAPGTGIELYGDPSDELREVAGSFGASIAGHWNGFTR